jgi:hypothetical protein
MCNSPWEMAEVDWTCLAHDHSNYLINYTVILVKDGNIRRGVRVNDGDRRQQETAQEAAQAVV